MPEEERIYRIVTADFDEAREAWRKLALTDDINEAGLQITDAALQGEFPTANAAARMLRGERTETIDVLESFI